MNVCVQNKDEKKLTETIESNCSTLNHIFPFLGADTHAHTAAEVKDTCLLGVGHSGSAACCHVAVEGNLQGVAVGCVVQQATKEPSAGAGLHHVLVEGCVRLEEDAEKQKNYIRNIFSTSG